MNVKHLALLAATGVVATCAMLITGSAAAVQASLPATLICEPMSSAYDVNDAGVVAGYVGSWPYVRAATCTNGTLAPLALPSDATGSIAVAINNAGQVVGQLNLTSGAQEAVVWNADGSMTRLGFFPGPAQFSSAQDINDHGWVVGVAGASGFYRAFLWRGSGPIESLSLPTGMTSSYAQAINNNGAIAGSASAGYPLPPPYPPSIAVVWQNGVAMTLPPLAEGAAASADDINDAGQVVGNSATTAAPWLVRDPVLWDNGSPIDLGSLGGNFGLATAINAEGVIAGYMVDQDNAMHGFTWAGGVTTLLDPLAGDTQSEGLGVNSSSEVVGISSGISWSTGRGVVWGQPGDTTPPQLSVSVTPNMLWPPNHKYVTVDAAVTTSDDSGVDPTVALVSVTSNEPDNALGDTDGNTVDDIVTSASDPYSFQLRAERDELGHGRIYTITYTATDASGNSATQSATVTVPLEQ